MRTFIAIELPASFKKEVASVQRQVRELCSAGRFVPGGNFHITLHFIGESDDLMGAVTAMKEAVRGIRPFNLHLGGCGSFARKADTTSVLHIRGELEELNALHESLEAALFDQGFSREHKRFVPHITLGRSVEYLPGAEEKLAALRPNASVRVQSLVLFESTREEGRMIYAPLHKEVF